MMRRLGFGAAIALCALLGVLYGQDGASVREARAVETFLEQACAADGVYPTVEALQAAFPHLYPGQEWYYWPNETRSRATFQYPMTLSLSNAPGESKYSEFFPVIYAFAVRGECHGMEDGV